MTEKRLGEIAQAIQDALPILQKSKPTISLEEIYAMLIEGKIGVILAVNGRLFASGQLNAELPELKEAVYLITKRGT